MESFERAKLLFSGYPVRGRKRRVTKKKEGGGLSMGGFFPCGHGTDQKRRTVNGGDTGGKGVCVISSKRKINPRGGFGEKIWKEKFCVCLGDCFLTLI